MKKLVAVGMAVACATAFASDGVKVWTGDASATWDTTSQNWILGETPCAFAQGDSVRIDETSTTAEITGAGMNPLVTEIDITRDLKLSGNLFGGSAGTLIKNGTGTLILAPASTWSWNAGNLETNLVINGGTVCSSVRAAESSFCAANGTITINNGGKLLCAVHCDTGIASTDAALAGGEQTVVVNEGGVLDLYTDRNSSGTTATGCHPLGSIILNGGTLKYGRGWGGAGFTEIHHLLSFAGKPYDLQYDYSEDRGKGPTDTGMTAQYIGLREKGKGLPEIRVPELTGDDGVDVRFGIALVKNNDNAAILPQGFRKTGAGTMQVVTNFIGFAKTLDGTIRIEEGLLDLAYQDVLDLTPDREIYVGTNAELRASKPYALNQSDITLGKLNVGNTTIHVDHGTFTLVNPTTDAGAHTFNGNESYNANNFVGGLILDHATFDYSSVKTGDSNTYTWLTLGKIFKVVSDEPYVFEPAKEIAANYGIALRPYSAAYAGSDSAAWVLDLYTNAAMRGTEICVDRIPGNTEKFDLLINAPFRLTRTAGANLCGGFVKTGTGTLALVNEHSTFAGDVTVRGGTLLLATNAYSALAREDGDNSILGRFKGSTYATDWKFKGRTITVEDKGVLEFGARNFWAGYTKTSIEAYNVKFVVRNGGKLKFNEAAFNVIPNLTVEDGEIEVGLGWSGYGCFKLRGPMTVRGTKPFSLEYRGGATTFTQNNLPGIEMTYSPRTEFNVADMTGDDAADMTLGLVVFREGGGDKEEAWTTDPMAFKKTGNGTLRYTANRHLYENRNLLGDCDVEAGALLLDGDALYQVTAKVAAGAFIGGTGTVQNVTLAEGAGFAATAGQRDRLNVTGDLTMPETGVIEIANPDGLPLDEVGARLVKVGGTFTRPASFAGWKVKVDGVETDLAVTATATTLRAGARDGLMLIVR